MVVSRAPTDGNATQGSQDWFRFIDEKTNKVEINWTATAAGASNRSSPFPINGMIKKINFSKSATYTLTDEDGVSFYSASPAGAIAEYPSIISSGGNTDFPFVVCGTINLNITSGGVGGTGTVRIYLE
jgi:hypothetical protein